MRRRDPFVTLTGVDERCSKRDLTELLVRNVEVGILLSANPEGRHRYPSLEWIGDAVSFLGDRCAIHFCGRAAREGLLDSQYDWLVDRVGRIQINGSLADSDLDWALAHWPEKTIITQWAFTPEEYRDIHETSDNHAILIDGSGGRGIVPKAWPEIRHPVKDIGFAGGLSPENIKQELTKILAIAQGGAWIDMESSLRVDDWFSMERAREVVRAVSDSFL